METGQIIIIICIVAVTIAILLSPFISSKDLKVTIKMEEDEGYPLKNDGVEELIVKPKRRYKKRIPKNNVIKTTPVAKKPVERPKKVN
jgi:beta-lactam-binding protein with PASTA domain